MFVTEPNVQYIPLPRLLVLTQTKDERASSFTALVRYAYDRQPWLSINPLTGETTTEASIHVDTTMTERYHGNGIAIRLCYPYALSYPRLTDHWNHLRGIERDVRAMLETDHVDAEVMMIIGYAFGPDDVNDCMEC